MEARINGETPTELERFHAENERLRAALDSIGDMAYTAAHLDDGQQHCSHDEFMLACMQILDAANEALQGGAA